MNRFAMSRLSALSLLASCANGTSVKQVQEPPPKVSMAFEAPHQWPAGTMYSDCVFKSSLNTVREKHAWRIEEKNGELWIDVTTSEPSRVLPETYQLKAKSDGRIVDIFVAPDKLAKHLAETSRPTSESRAQSEARYLFHLQRPWHLAVSRWIDLRVPHGKKVIRTERSMARDGTRRSHQTEYFATTAAGNTTVTGEWSLTGPAAEPFLSMLSTLTLLSENENENENENRNTPNVKTKIRLEFDAATQMPSRVVYKKESKYSGEPQVATITCSYRWRGE